MIRFFKTGIILLILSFSLSSCLFRAPRTVGRCFYYWKSDFTLNRRENALLQRLQIDRLYLRFFDVVWDPSIGGPVPAAPVRFLTAPPRSTAIIPTVYITNQSLTNLAAGQVTTLADKISSKIERMIAAARARGYLRRVPEAQIDCDWTLSTRAKYFQLLERLKTHWAGRLRLSATIRLHQVKYLRQTGVPPVDRGMLMFYNLVPVNNFKTKNSILDADVGKSYLTDLKRYPLPLDVALPLFSWGAIFQDDHFIALANDFSRQELTANSSFEVFKESPNYFRVKRNIYLHHTQLYRGDLIRVEESEARTLQECATYLAQRLRARPARNGDRPAAVNVALFHLDLENVRRIGDDQIADIFARFR